MKLFAFLREKSAQAEALADSLAAHPAVARSALNLCDDPAAPYAAVLEVAAPRLPAEPLALRLATLPGAEVYRSRELVELPPPQGPFPGIKLIAPWVLKPGVSPAEGRRHWDEHVPLARSAHVGASAYVRHWVEACYSPGAPAWRGIAILWFDTAADLRERLFGKPEDLDAVTRDVADFVGDTCTLFAREYTQEGRGA